MAALRLSAREGSLSSTMECKGRTVVRAEPKVTTIALFLLLGAGRGFFDDKAIGRFANGQALCYNGPSIVAALWKSGAPPLFLL